MKTRGLYSNNKTMTLLYLLLALILLTLVLGVFYKLAIIKTWDNKFVAISSLKVLEYDKETSLVSLEIVPVAEHSACAVTTEEDVENLKFIDLKDGKCIVTIPTLKHYLYFKAKTGEIIESKEINDYIISVDLENKYYLSSGTTINIENSISKVGNPIIEWKFDENYISLDNNLITPVKNGTTQVSVVANGEVTKTISITSTDVIVTRPLEFDSKKSVIGCEEFSQEEATLLDEILEYRIEKAGYQTRAGVVEAARFLTLEFPYRIPYYWENGRLHYSGANYVDGEGRYYHKGLYLSKDKYEKLEASISGPKMWGCKMTNWEDDEPRFIRGNKYPNGLDCSGFVTWALYNGGYDPGDIGAGDTLYGYELTDLGDFQKLTSDVISSGKIKVGDLLNTPGHIAIIIGIDSEHFYVAESLNTYEGVVLKTYTKNKLLKTFEYVEFMDSYYIEDGNLTNMWY